jgi:RsiW-degrading membrane proteinase PrsW (M82 family)
MKKSVLIVLGVIIIFIVLINVFLKDPIFDSSQKQIDFLFKSRQYSLAEDLYKDLMRQDSTNIDFCYGHITSHFRIPKTTSRNQTERDDLSIYDFYQKKSHSADATQKDIGFYGTGLIYLNTEENEKALLCLFKVENKDLKYLNNSIGYAYLQDLKLDSAEYFFKREIQNKGNLEGAYSNIINLYLKTNQLDKFGSLLNNSSKKYFISSDLREYYLKTGKPLKYLNSLVLTGFNNADMQGFIAALLIMLIWLFYLRRIDLFEPEKWSNIIFTFLLGVLFSYGTFILSDFNHHIIGFDLNGKVFNDFIFCFFGIGLIEELMKLIPFLIILKFTKAVNEPIDYIIYISVSALGFAFAENLSYFHGLGLEIIHVRALVAVVIHMICSSIIGYGLYLNMYKTRAEKIRQVIVFFIIAAFVHGFYDFWLINKTAHSFGIISFFILIIGISVWNSFITNALNSSIPENENLKNLNHLKLQDYLIYGLSGVLIFEYLIVSFIYGPKAGNESLIKATINGAYLIAFISTSLSNYKLKRNYRGKIRFLFKRTIDPDAIIGERIAIVRITEDIHNVFPLSGEVVAREKVQNEKFWYLIQLDKALEHYNVCKDYIMIKAKNNTALKDNCTSTLIGVYMIKTDEAVQSKNKTKSDLVFVEWAKVS